MFTPPPSPQPAPGLGFDSKAETPSPMSPSSRHSTPHPSASFSLSPRTNKTREDAKRRTGRRFRNAVILVPIILIAITATARILSCGHLLDSPNTKQTWSNLLSSALFENQPQRVHLSKREPNPQQPAATASSSPAASPSSSTPSSLIQPIPTVPATPPPLPTPFPQAFDGVLSQNFSSVSCLNFMTNLISAQNFRTCRPFSMLLQTSGDFISAQSNITLLNSLIWGTCNTATTEQQCISNMATYATNLKTQCADDLKANSAMVVETLQALDAFGLLRDAACLTDPTTNTYCYVNAARDTNPTNLYYYSAPLGLSVPPSSDPQCTACLKSLMGLYGTAVTSAVKTNTLLPLQHTYESAAELTVGKCGAGYAQVGLVSAAGPSKHHGLSGHAPLAILSTALGLWTLLGSFYL